MLEVRNVFKSFEVSGGEHRVIEDLSFTVQDKDFFIILGKSGCGKSTLLRMIGGFGAADKGDIRLDGTLVDKPSKDMMMVFQSFDQLFPWYTLKGNLVYALKKAGIMAPGGKYDEYAAQYLKMAGLEGFTDSYPHQLSGGMKQRGALARALCLKPRILLMDEPFSSLDYITKRSLYKSIAQMKAQTGATVVMVTHDIEEALLLGTSIAVLAGGSFAEIHHKRKDGFDTGLKERLEGYTTL